MNRFGDNRVDDDIHTVAKIGFQTSDSTSATTTGRNSFNISTTGRSVFYFLQQTQAPLCQIQTTQTIALMLTCYYCKTYVTKRQTQYVVYSITMDHYPSILVILIDC